MWGPGGAQPPPGQPCPTWMMSLVKGSVMIFSSPGASWPPWMLKEATTSRVAWYRYPVATSRGSRTRTDSQLKQSCTVAPAKALGGEGRGKVAGAWTGSLWGSWHLGRPSLHKHGPVAALPPHLRKSVLSPACIRATMVLVTEVPMLEPMMMGMAELTSSTGRGRGRVTRGSCPPSSCPHSPSCQTRCPCSGHWWAFLPGR